MTDVTGDVPLVLLIEDDPQLRRFLRASLHAEGFRLLEADTGERGIELARTQTPDVILLDLGLPDLDGIKVTERLRGWTRIPIIVISARGREADKVEALDAGADDYLTKPFGVSELLARIRVAFRHTEALPSGEQPVLEVGGLRLDLDRHQVTRDDREIRLTPIEYKILTLLARHPGKVLTHRQLLKQVWGPAAQDQTHYLRVYMAQLRRKIEKDPARPHLLVTEPGVGYRLHDEG
jgi:two-component system, OmpR family, KDP operon response regulator KdpE